MRVDKFRVWPRPRRAPMITGTRLHQPGRGQANCMGRRYWCHDHGPWCGDRLRLFGEPGQNCMVLCPNVGRHCLQQHVTTFRFDGTPLPHAQARVHGPARGHRRDLCMTSRRPPAPPPSGGKVILLRAQLGHETAGHCPAASSQAARPGVSPPPCTKQTSEPSPAASGSLGHVSNRLYANLNTGGNPRCNGRCRGPLSAAPN